MDANSVYMWWIKGARGIVNGLKGLTDERAQPSEGAIELLDDFIHALIVIKAKMQDIKDKG